MSLLNATLRVSISVFSVAVVAMALLHDYGAFLVLTLAFAASHAGIPSSFSHSAEN